MPVRETKKDHIIRLAQDDPFLRVEEIAAAAGTTSRYVRTTLSEARLSLMDLRRNYVRHMEKHMKAHIAAGSDGEQSITEYDSNDDKQSEENAVDGVRLMKFIDPEINDALMINRSQPLLKISRVTMVDGKPLYIEEIITHKNLTVSEDMVSSKKPLRQLLALEKRNATQFINRYIEMENASKRLAERLSITEGAPVIKSTHIITIKGERVAIENNYGDGIAVRINLANWENDADAVCGRFIPHSNFFASTGVRRTQVDKS